MIKVAGTVVLCLVFGLALVWGVAGCGDDGSTSGTTVQTDTTAGGTDTTAGGTDTTAGGSAESSDLVGKWYSAEMKETLEFTADGQMIWTKDGGEAQTFTYKVEMGALVFTQLAAPEDNTMAFSLAGDKLTTEDRKYGAVTYTKQ
jgi:hypothetical protein